MTPFHVRSSRLLFFLSWLLVPALAPMAAARQGGRPTAGPPSLPPGVTREQMWRAPTAEEWKKPCLIQWQRSYEDAIAVSKETGKPLLVCVNMDGEIASEHYAGVRYREAEIAKLYEPYVCVIASVYRHAPRDHDEQGRRILCPRFGSVTCGEHVAIEPGLYDKFMDGQRVAPRHIAVELDGKEKYDVYFAWDTDTIFNSLREGVAGRPDPKTIVRGDRPITERVASRDIADRLAVEAAYEQGDATQRKALLDAAKAHPEAAPTELLRQGVFGFDVDLSKLAREALAKAEAPDAANLIGDALRVPMEPPERQELVDALQRLGESSPRARTLAVVYQGLGSRSSTLDVEGWRSALERASTEKADPAARAERLGRQDEALASQDPAAHLDLALAFAEDALAHETGAGGGDREEQYSRLLWMDAQATALKAERLGARGWRVDAIVALAAAHLGDRAEARRRAEAAAGALPDDPETTRSAAALAVLELFARSRGDQIGQALRAKTTWPAQWLADLHAAYTLLLQHPMGTDAHAASHYDVLLWLGAGGEAKRFLEVGLQRFPTSAALHSRMRTRALEERGAAGLEAAYDEWLARAWAAKDGETPPDLAALEGFAGYASLVAAEFQRRAGDFAQSLAAYDRGIARYEHAIAAAPDDRAAADHYVAMALAGRARVLLEQKELGRSLADLLASFARRPDAIATQDGLGITPAATARDLRLRLIETEQAALVEKLEAAILELDPELLRQPDTESLLPEALRTR